VKSSKLEESTHYYMEGERVIFTALFHINRGQCCGNGCRHCPYEPKHTKGKVVVAKEFRKLIHKEDKNGSE
jgi:2-iminoacetate synthase ThiH